MIRSLRIKFVAMGMTIVMVMLALMLAIQFGSTRAALEAASLKALKIAAQTPPEGFGPSSNPLEGEQPCFVLALNHQGRLLAEGDDYYNLSDEQMNLAVFNAAFRDGREAGVLEKYNLRYYRADSPMEMRYVFTDVRIEQETLHQLLRTSVFIGLAGTAGFLVVTILLAYWAVRPVERAWEEQRRFVADASHELKTPLTVILTNAQLLREPDYDRSQKDQFSQSILTMSHQMRALVENLLELARTDSGQNQPRMERLDWSRRVEAAALPFEPVYFENGLTLESSIQPGVEILGSPEQLCHVVEILLDNARKYSSHGGTVRLGLSVQCRQAILTVASPGRTLTPCQCRDIFRRFYRVDAVRSRDGSCGLGLSIAQSIVCAHRGRIWAEGRGGVNTFFVSLPVISPCAMGKSVVE